MCFSTTASFAASSLLAGAGIVSIRMVREPRLRAFAAIPLIFAVQQFIEGCIWLLLEEDPNAGSAGMLARGYLLLAQVLWPVWVPWSFRNLEQDDRRRRWLGWCMAAGGVAAAYLGWALLASAPQVDILGHHVHYTIHYPLHMEHPSSVLYFTATVVAAFLSSVRRMWWLGLTLLLSYAVARVVFAGHVISVWCYFAALISVVVVHLVHAQAKAT
jgi:hypothetical protein